MKMEIIIIMIMLGMILPVANVRAATMKIYPSDDAFVRDTKSGTNYGSDIDLRTGYEKSFGTDRSYLKFNLPSLQNLTVNSAVFSFEPNANQNSPIVKLYYVSSDSWNENSITWSNKPSYSNLVTTSETINNNDRINLPLSNYINEQDSILSLVLIEDNEDGFVQFFSKDFNGSDEDKVRWPYIEVEYTEGECPSSDYSNVCCELSALQMMGFINKFNKFETSYSALEMMGFINKFNKFEPLC